MNVQYILDSKGKQTAVILPIKDSQNIKNNYLGNIEESIITKNDIIDGLNNAIIEVKKAKADKSNLKSAREFLSEIKNWINNWFPNEIQKVV